MSGRSHSGPLPALSAEEAALRDRLTRHVGRLAGEIGERNLWRHEALEAAARYVEETLRSLGHPVRDQPFRVGGKTVRNLEVELEGASRPGEIVVAGAHYDSVPGCPGANDNATGIAATLEIARRLTGRRLVRTVRLLAFVNEEPPFFLTGDMGSLLYARRAREEGRDIVAMLSLETIGFYSEEPGSQRYPFPLGLLYPSRGNFIGFVGNLASRDLVRRALSSFRGHTAFPCEGLAAPGWVPGVSWSDHWSFWQQGYPAVMVTDTALFRYEHYHTEADTPERIDYDRMARVVAGLARVVAELAGGDQP